jgi:hypothetical protein
MTVPDLRRGIEADSAQPTRERLELVDAVVPLQGKRADAAQLIVGASVKAYRLAISRSSGIGHLQAKGSSVEYSQFRTNRPSALTVMVWPFRSRKVLSSSRPGRVRRPRK